MAVDQRMPYGSSRMVSIIVEGTLFLFYLLSDLEILHLEQDLSDIEILLLEQDKMSVFKNGN